MCEPGEPEEIHQGGLAELVSSGVLLRVLLPDIGGLGAPGGAGQDLGSRCLFSVCWPCCCCLSLLAQGCALGMFPSLCDGNGRKGNEQINE